ncbi:MAG TPA: hypothetical protein VF189_00920 [Patescibacteria group bacterium]
MEKRRNVVQPFDSSVLNPDRLIRSLAKKAIVEEAEKRLPLDEVKEDARLLGVSKDEIAQAASSADRKEGKSGSATNRRDQ